LVHRRIKPGSIVFKDAKTPLLLGFGLIETDDLSLPAPSEDGARLSGGTLPYTAPEVLQGKACTPAGDLYALSAVLYECLAGHPPFHQGSIEQQILQDDPTPPLGDGSPLERAILAGLSKRPNDRPGSFAAMVAMVDPAAEPPTSQASSASFEENDPPEDAPYIPPADPQELNTSLSAMDLPVVQTGERLEKTRPRGAGPGGLRARLGRRPRHSGSAVVLICLGVVLLMLWRGGYFDPQKLDEVHQAAEAKVDPYQKAERLFLLSDYEQAAEHYKRALQRDPQGHNAPDILNNLGMCYENLGQGDRALKWYNRLSQEYPETTQAEAAQRRASILRASGYVAKQ
jgi:hypothetical protein